MVQRNERTPRVLLVAATTGYQIRAFGDAAERLGVTLVFATDRCHQLDDPWRDGAIAVRFHDEAASVRAIVASTVDGPIDAVVAVGDRPALMGALAARALSVPAHPPEAVRVAGNKLMTRVRLHEADLPSPRFWSVPPDTDPASLRGRVTFPCVVKPLTLAASRGVMRADTPEAFEGAVARLRRMLSGPDVQALRDPANDAVLVEEYIPGREVAVEGVVTNGELRIFALFDKPDPLVGPYFEETVYVTPDSLSEVGRRRVVKQSAAAVAALGLTYGPFHAECRLSNRGVVVLEVGARPIGGLCSRVLRFDGPRGPCALEEVLLRHALGRPVADYCVTSEASAVMMIPVPRGGIFKGVRGLDAARSETHIEDIIVTAKAGQQLVPWPEGASYPGFIFARGPRPDDVVAAVRAAHQRLSFEIAPAIPVNAEHH